MSGLALSVVIPTRDRPGPLLRAVRSLAAARRAGELEVLVVDDGSEKPVGAALEEARGELNLSVHRQPPGGLNVARNAGIARTSGSAIAFLDDDVRVEPGWAEGLIVAFAEPEPLAVAAGRTIADSERPLPPWIRETKMLYISVLDLGDEPMPLPEHYGPVGANLAVAREWLERVGGFHAGLDRSGRSLISGGDTELVRRIEAAGGRVRYWPAATVHHHIPAERLTRAWFRRRAEAQGVSDVRALYACPPTARELGFEIVRPLRAPAIAATRLLSRSDPIDAELWLWSTRGRWRELRRLTRESRA